MDISEYISSGILDLYVAGALEPDEMRSVEQMAERHPEVRVEIAAIEAVAQALLQMQEQERAPSPGLRDRILDRIDKVESEGKVHQLDARPAVPSTPEAGQGMKYLLAASLALTMLSTSAAGYFGYQFYRTRNELAAAVREKDRMAEDRGVLKSRLDRSNSDLALLRSPESRVVELKGLPVAAGARARVYWNSRTRQVLLDKGSLPEPPAGRQYQLWAIGGEGPVDDGMVEKRSDDIVLQRMKDVASADAFAITLEPEGGSAAPTLEKMYAMGKL